MDLELRLLSETKYSDYGDPKLELWGKALTKIRAFYNGPLADPKEED